MSDINRKTLLEWSRREFYSAKERGDEGAMLAYQNLKYAIDTNEIESLPFTETEGQNASLITTIESQKEEIEDIKRHQGEYIASLEFEVESLKAITELAVKGLQEIRDVYNGGVASKEANIANNTLSEIGKLQNE